MDLDPLSAAIRAKEAERRKKLTRPTGPPGAFEAALDQARAVEEPPSEFPAFLRDIDEAAARFARQFAPEALIDYKKAVRKFLEAFLAASHGRQRITNFDPSATGDYVLLVRRIDDRLEDLSRQFVTQEGDQLKLLALLDEIRGLLMDLSA